MRPDQLDISKLKQWPFKEAKQLQNLLKKSKPKSGAALFETGFGPSGLPHIGTFAEVARTTWVRHAFELMAEEPTRLIAFSDDMDGLRKVPDNMPNQNMLRENLGRPLCDIPDPFEEHDSYSGHMNAKLREFLDHFGFDYEFKASRKQYRGGVFNDGLERILQRYEDVRGVILPTLSPENRDDWSPFMPICTSCGCINTTRVTEVSPADGTIAYACDQEHLGGSGCGHTDETEVTDGAVKVGWKVDWALRWYTFGVNYEMYGKDLIDSANLSGRICRILGGEPPVGMFYEMFLDENGQKISKSRGNGLTIDEWLRYGPLESLGLFIYKRPDRASRLYFDVIPQHVDEYLRHRRSWTKLDTYQRYNSPVWFIHHDELEAGEDITLEPDLNFSMLLNLVGVLNTDDREVIWDYILRYSPEVAEERELFDVLVDKAVAYYRDFVLPTKSHRLPPAEVRPAVDNFIDWLEDYEGDDAKEIQNAAYSAGKGADVGLGDFFKAMYLLLLGQEQGPRLGTFIKIYGPEATLELAKTKIAELEAKTQEDAEA